MVASLATLVLAAAAPGPLDGPDGGLGVRPGELRSAAVGDLVAELSNPARARDAAAKLVTFGRAAVPGLLRALSAGPAHARYYAATVLDVVGGPETADAFLAILRNEKEEPALRLVAARALGRLGDPRAVPVLLSLARRSTPAGEAGPKIEERGGKTAATRPSSVSGPPSSVPPVTPAALAPDGRTAREFRFEVVRALAYGGGPESFPLLMASLGDPDPRVREAACQGLGDNRVAEAATALRACLSDPEGVVVRAAALALGKLGRTGGEAVPDLIRALSHPSPAASRAARTALVLVTGLSLKRDEQWAEWWEARRAAKESGGAVDDKEAEGTFVPFVPLPPLARDEEPSTGGAPAGEAGLKTGDRGGKTAAARPSPVSSPPSPVLPGTGQGGRRPSSTPPALRPPWEE